MPTQISKSSARRFLKPTTLSREYMRSTVAQTPTANSVHISATGYLAPEPVGPRATRWEGDSAMYIGQGQRSLLACE